MRGKHQHEDSLGQRWDCADAGCKKPFKCNNAKPQITRRPKKQRASWDTWAAKHVHGTGC
jgi:hypothetical protein